MALAEAIGVSQPYVGQMELGQRTGDGATLVRLAKALGVRVDDLVGQAAGDDERAPGAT